MDKIEHIHKLNKNLIAVYNLKKGIKLKLKTPYGNLKEVTIKHIHKLYGWILLEETEQLPQEVKKLLSLIELKGGLKK